MMNGGRCFEISRGGGDSHIPRAFFVKDEAQHIRARRDGGLRVGQVRDAANFDFDAHFSFVPELV